MIDSKLMDGDYEAEIILLTWKNLFMARLISDHPGMWKAYHRLATAYSVRKKQHRARELGLRALKILDTIEYSLGYTYL